MRVNGDWKQIGFGAAIVLVGLTTGVAQVRTWIGSAPETVDETDDYERNFLRRRSRRRLQTSLLLTCVGLLVGLHSFVVPDPKAAPRLFAGWWLSALLLAGWIIVLALFDIAATRAHARVQLARLHLRQRELRRQFDDLRSQSSEG